jgi:hypothetical protein
MLDITTRKPLYVSTDGDAGPYIMVPVDLLERVKTILDADGIRYWVDEEAITLDDQPEIAVINLGHGSDPATIQRLLDSVP